MYISVTTKESNMEIPQNTKNRIYRKECTPGYDRATCTCMFIAAAAVYNSQDLEVAQMSHD
jgi:hypothetical protein